MTFGCALEEAINGKRISRIGWNGKNMWVAYMEPITLPEGVVNGRTKKFVPTGDLHVGGYFAMMTADGTWQPGWLASQMDMVSSDWDTLD